MEKVKVIFEIEVIYYLDALIKNLYLEDYFSYIENAETYVERIYEFVEHNIHTFPHKKTPVKLSHLGSSYIFYKSNSRTTWYLFFELRNSNYLITGILNNHCAAARFI